MTTRTTTFGQGSQPTRAVDLKTGIRRRPSTERAIWRSSGLRTEDFSTIAPPYLSAFCSPAGSGLPMAYLREEAKQQITQNVVRHCDSEDQSGNVGRDGGHNSMVQHSPRKRRFNERNEYLLRSVDSGDGGQRHGCCARDPASRSQLKDINYDKHQICSESEPWRYPRSSIRAAGRPDTNPHDNRS